MSEKPHLKGCDLLPYFWIQISTVNMVKIFPQKLRFFTLQP